MKTVHTIGFLMSLAIFTLSMAGPARALPIMGEFNITFNQTLPTIDTWTGMFSSDAAGNVWAQTRDAEGRLISSWNPLGKTVQFDRDILGRVTDVITPIGNTTHLTYDAFGRFATVLNPSDELTTLTYSPRGALASIALPEGISTSYGRDARGALNRITDPGGNDLRSIASSELHPCFARQLARFGGSRVGKKTLQRTAENEGPPSNAHHLDAALTFQAVESRA